MQWNDGYVSDISYAGGFYREQMPSNLDANCLVLGVTPPAAPGAPFTYCELGCGLGGTAMVIAAAYPQAKVWGFDFNPAHVAHGRDRAARAGLDNLVLAERSFEDLAAAAPGELPRFDYVTLHGVWSWISPANRAHIVRFLRDRVAPGGLVSVSYNALPGWAGSTAMQHLLIEIGRSIGRGSESRVRGAIAMMRRIADTKGSDLDPKLVARLETMLEEGHLSYLSHEYLNDHWAPVFCAEVAAALAPAKLDFAGSANMLENFPELCVGPEALALLRDLPTELRQTVGDFFCPRTFRRDVFIRGSRPLPAGERRRRLGEQRLALVLPPENTTCEIKAPVGKATLNKAFYAPAMVALGRGNAAIDDLLAAAAPGTAPSREDVLGVLVGSHQALPVCAAADASARARVRRFNLSRIADAVADGEQACWLAGAAVGTAVQARVMEMLIYEVVAAQPDGAALPVDRVRAGVVELMAGRGMSFNRSEAEVAEGTDSVAAEVEEFAGKILPIWQRIGVL